MIKWSEESHSAHSLGFIRLTTKRLHYVFSGALIKSWYYNLWYCYKGHNIAHNNDPQALHSMKYQVSQSKAEKTRTTGTENLTTVRLQDLRWRNGWGTLDIPQRMICKHQNKFDRKWKSATCLTWNTPHLFIHQQQAGEKRFYRFHQSGL